MLLGGDITVKFTALQSSKAPKLTNEALDEVLENRILDIIRENPKIKQTEIIDMLGITRTKLQRRIKLLVERGIIERKGGKRYGYWEINRWKTV